MEDSAEVLDDLLHDLLGDNIIESQQESADDHEPLPLSFSPAVDHSLQHDASDISQPQEEIKVGEYELQQTPCMELSLDNLDLTILPQETNQVHKFRELGSQLGRPKFSLHENENEEDEDASAAHLLEWAEQQESFLSQSFGISPHLSLIQELDTLLASTSDEEWHPMGRPNAAGTSMIGGSVSLELRQLDSSPHPPPPPSHSSGSTNPSNQGAIDLQEAWAKAGKPKVVACGGARRGGVVAVGTDSGTLVVFQMPSPSILPPPLPPYQSPSTPTTHNLEASDFLTQVWAQAQEGQAKEGGVRSLIILGRGMGLSGGRQEVTALGFSTIPLHTSSLPTGGTPPPFWVLAGHASGLITAWDLNLAHRVSGSMAGPPSNPMDPRSNPAALPGHHSHPVVHVSFIPGRGVIQALSADSAGKLSHHSISVPSASSSLVLASKPTVQSKILLDQDLGVITSISHLSPSHSDHASGGLMGDGMMAICSSTGLFICHISVNGDFSLLFSIPDPSPPIDKGSFLVPTADWLPAPPIKQEASDGPPCALLAVSWHDRIQIHSVPLLDKLAHSLARDRMNSSAVKESKAAPDNNSSSQTALPSSSTIFKAMAAVAASAASATASAAAAASSTPFTFGSVGQGAAAAAASLLNLPVSTANVMHAATSSPSIDPLVLQAVIHDLTLQYPVTPCGQWLGEEWRREVGIESIKIMGIAWLNPHSLGLVVASGFISHIISLRAAHSQSTSTHYEGVIFDIEDHLECLDVPMLRKHPQTQCWSGSIASCKNQILTLGSTGLVSCKLMSCQERLFTALALGKWRLGIKLGLDCMKQRSSHDHSDPSTFTTELAQWLLSLLLGHISSVLVSRWERGSTSTIEGSKEQRQRLASAARTAVALCLYLDQSLKASKGQSELSLDPLRILYSTVFEAFNQIPFASAAVLPDLINFSDEVSETPSSPPDDATSPLSFLMDAIEEKVLQGCISVLPPEIMQALVLHLSSSSPISSDQGVRTPSEPDSASLRVERCVIKLDVLSMDLNQVINLCGSLGLHSGLISVYNRLGEFKAPAASLLIAAAHASSSEGHGTGSNHSDHASGVCGSKGGVSEGSRLILKLLVYLRCVFENKSSPPTSLKSSTSPSNSSLDPRCQLMGLLLLLNTSDLIREAGGGGGRLRPVSLTDPHPALTLMLKLAPRPTLLVLEMAFKSWDAIETDLRSAIGLKSMEEMKNVSVASQLLVDALVSLVDSNRLRDEDSNDPARGNQAEDAAMVLLIKLVSSGRTIVPGSVALKLLGLVLSRAACLEASDADGIKLRQGSSLERLQSSLEFASRMEDAAWCYGASPREYEVIKLLRSLQYSSQEDREGNVVTEGEEMLLSWQESARAAEMSSAAGFYHASCLVHHLRGDYSSAVKSLLCLPATFSHSPSYLAQHSSATVGRRHPASEYLSLHLSQDSSTSFSSLRVSLGSNRVASKLRDVIPKMIEALSTHAIKLLEVDPLPIDATKLVLNLLPQSLHLSIALGSTGANKTTDELGDGTRLSFLTAARVLAVQERTNGETSLLDPSTIRDQLSSTAGGFSPGPANSLMDQPEVVEAFLSLLCKYTPQEALPYLISLYSSTFTSTYGDQGRFQWDVKKLLSSCRASKVSDAEAFLLERLGDEDEAAKLWLSHVQSSLDSLSSGHPMDKAWLMEKLQLLTRSVFAAVGFCGRSLKQRPLEEQVSSSTAYWLRLLDVILHQNDASGELRTGLGPEDGGDSLVRVRQMLAEEVVERITALLPPALVARSLALHYSSGMFGELKKPLTRIFETCAHEQSLVGATHRLIGGDAFVSLQHLMASKIKGRFASPSPSETPFFISGREGGDEKPGSRSLHLQGFHLLDRALIGRNQVEGVKATILIESRPGLGDGAGGMTLGSDESGKAKMDQVSDSLDIDEILAWAKA